VEENRKLNHETVLKQMYMAECTRLKKQNGEIEELLYRTRDEMQSKYQQVNREKEAAERCVKEYKNTVEQLQHKVRELERDRGKHFISSLNVCLTL
jgi:gas vesicle protein